MPARALHPIDARHLRCRQGLGDIGREQLREAEHRVQGRAQFMAHARQEFALGPIGRLGHFARAFGHA